MNSSTARMMEKGNQAASTIAGSKFWLCYEPLKEPLGSRRPEAELNILSEVHVEVKRVSHRPDDQRRLTSALAFQKIEVDLSQNTNRTLDHPRSVVATFLI